jgi:hypothetical protein
MNARPAIVQAILLFERLDQFGKIESLVYLDEQVIRIDEVPQSLRGELE